MNLCKTWDGSDLYGEWEFSAKIDGIRAISDGVKARSRAGNHFPNLDHVAHLFTDAEIFCGSFEATGSVLKSKKPVKIIQPRDIYSFSPLDPRLDIFKGEKITNPTKEFIKEVFENAVKVGFEGIVMKKGDTWLRVKAHETFDVPCLSFREGEKGFTGTLGAIETPMGDVGTGFDMKLRHWFWKVKPVGVVIEVECNRLTESGRFRHASFKRIRWDKTPGKKS